MAAGRRSSEERARIVEEFAKSGLRQGEFCAQHGLNVHTLQNWLYASRSAAATRSRRTSRPFVRVVRGDVGPSAEHALRLELPGGVALRLVELPPATYLAQLCRLVGC